jgi:tRNA (guanine-N7-)-methyltransferase
MSRGRRISRVKFNPPSKKISANYLRDLDSKLLFQNPAQFPKLTSEELFNQSGLISLDIGCGTGEFTNAIAIDNPRERFVGIEISRRAVYHAVNQAARHQLNNVLYLRVDFKLINPLLAPNSLLNVYLNFPDPNYGGENRRKHRIFNQDFLEQMYHSLVPDGTIQVVTDQEPFLMDMLAIAEADQRFAKSHSDDYLEGFSPPKKTRFQIAWEKFDRPVFRFELKKSD